MRLALIAALTTAVAAPIIAQSPPTAAPGSKNLAAVTGGTYTVDADQSMVKWTVDNLGFTPYTGIFGDVGGTLTLDPKNPSAAKIDVTIPVAKVTTASSGLTSRLLRAGKDGGKADFFGANPADAKFVSTSVVASGETARITGNLTLNGFTKSVTLDAKFYGAGKEPATMGGKENVGFTAIATIKRSDFGLGFIPMVSDAVQLEIIAAFRK